MAGGHAQRSLKPSASRFQRGARHGIAWGELAEPQEIGPEILSSGGATYLLERARRAICRPLRSWGRGTWGSASSPQAIPCRAPRSILPAPDAEALIRPHRAGCRVAEHVSKVPRERLRPRQAWNQRVIQKKSVSYTSRFWFLTAWLDWAFRISRLTPVKDSSRAPTRGSTFSAICAGVMLRLP